MEFVPQLLVFLLFCVLMHIRSEKCNSKYHTDPCMNMGHLKGLMHMMESVSVAMTDIVSKAKFRAKHAEEGLCINPQIRINSSVTVGSASKENDHCVTAELDCSALRKAGFSESGVYRIWPRFLNHSLSVYCDMDTDGGGWTLIQRRGEYEPHIDFFETWDNYKKGFGNLEEEFWLGNDAIFALTNQARMIIRFDLEDFDGNKRFAKYPKFLVRSELENYKMTIGEYQGTAGDSFRDQNDKDFSTKDHGNMNCAREFKAGWWYNACHHSNLNGLYHHGYHSTFADGVNWLHFKGYNYSLKISEMKIRPCDC